jgi:hypothetical protein
LLQDPNVTVREGFPVKNFADRDGRVFYLDIHTDQIRSSVRPAAYRSHVRDRRPGLPFEACHL